MGTANFALAAALGEWSSVSDGGVPNLQYRLRLCPHLRRLTVEGANFNQRLGHYGRFGDVVRDCLDIRKQAGVRVDVLEVTNCPMVSEDDAQFLEKSVGIVTWHRVDVGLQDEGRDAESTLLLVR
ncbi:hypothetical protein JAAARDRAFT_40686 [Jaapia argillacea MUCL 33604]|uniref:Uncharacterized protein n=1 Tax=Jaapia argillacea MUCL 33604 TaxID=933084 RepID=A0A067PDE3_9AGAM|nr:hypothetical protein JAAARDRAFT_40686 [Jaapia argillacea MUCL 33604]